MDGDQKISEAVIAKGDSCDLHKKTIERFVSIKNDTKWR